LPPRPQVLEQEEQLEQGAKVIRYLQAQLGQLPGGSGGGSGGGGPSDNGAPPGSGGGGGGRAPGGGGGGGAREALLLEQLEAAQDECGELRCQVAALQDDVAELAARRPGTGGGMSSELRRQVQELQVGAGAGGAGGAGAMPGRSAGHVLAVHTQQAHCTLGGKTMLLHLSA
jgi:hypothetical protein